MIRVNLTLLFALAFLASCAGTRQSDLYETAKKGILAIRTDNIDDLKSIIRSANGQVIRDEDGDTLLFWAVIKDRPKMVTYLLESGYSPDANSTRGYTPLLMAAQEDRSQMALELLAKSKEKHNTTFDGFTALHFAARHGDTKLCEALLKHGSLVNARSVWGDTPLIRACINGKVSIECIEFLIKSGADIDAKGHNGRTALSWARVRNRTDIVNALTRLRHE